MSGSTQKADKRKAPKTAFKKGVSGNPMGRKKLTAEDLDLVAACKAKTSQALDTILDIMANGENEKNRLTAALAVIERGYGKPVQPVDAEHSGMVAFTWQS